jgi:hypothetical protein
MFATLPEHIWILTEAVSGARRQELLSTPFEAIVAEIASRGTPGKPKLRRNRDPIFDNCPRSLKRYRVEILLPCNLVDLFHNGAGGYRAQFYESIALGDEANAYCRDAILPLIRSQEMKRRLNWMDTPAAASLNCQTTKVWIYQGQWIRPPRLRLQNLRVRRWQCDKKLDDTERKKRWKRSMLAPDNETRINLIGGWLHCSDQKPLDRNHKPLRSQHIHYFGFT